MTVLDETLLKKYFNGDTAPDFELRMERWRSTLSRLTEGGWLKAAIERRDGLYQLVSSDYLANFVQCFGKTVEISAEYFHYQTTFVIKVS